MKFFRFFLLLTFFIFTGAARAGLTADQIALVVNRAEPQGIELANFYAQARGIPADRIIELNLPLTEEMPFDRYEREVLPQVRQFLTSHGLQDKVRCLVTFYGVPLRMSDRVNNARDIAELSQLRREFDQATSRFREIVTSMEMHASEFDPSFKPLSSDNTLDALAQRGQLSVRGMASAINNSHDPEQQKIIENYLREVQTLMNVPVELAARSATAPTTLPTDSSVADLTQRQFDPAARKQLREQIARTGILNYARLLQSQIAYFDTQASGSALDNELACLWWPMYSRTQWQLNPLDVHFRRANTPKTLMVMRLDAPTPLMVRDLILNCLATEKEGLKGKIVIDARGIAPTDRTGKVDGFGMFDERLRRLAAMVQEKSSLPILFDDKPAVLGANSTDDVALYCGWYSVRNYIPSMKFNRGAIGYHVASFELISLHDPHEPGWVRGLMYAGVVGTVGSVAEPYLHSFPPPDEFFPLVMSGKMTLAEAYWTTTPCVSWMQSCIGDPLYNPYAKNPAMKIDDLPETLRSVVE
ncbi:MAG TPA: TIGR03790 family protein [Tepidisphaeraceae bacterium]|nr:TIGR03790 family protein [Tepidisphaeraceae bacterium]